MIELIDDIKALRDNRLTFQEFMTRHAQKTIDELHEAHEIVALNELFKDIAVMLRENDMLPIQRERLEQFAHLVVKSSLTKETIKFDTTMKFKTVKTPNAMLKYDTTPKLFSIVITKIEENGGE